jgi:hypothetical protein
MTKNRPYFLWDYDLSEDDVRAILHTGGELDKQWLIARILTSARFEDVWKYLTVKDLVFYFAKLRMRPQVKLAWKRALNVWGYEV